YYPEAFFEGFDRDLRHHRRRYTRQAAFLPQADSFSTPPRLLDVGCATGGFPRFMRERGWTVEGVEVSEAAGIITDFPVHRRPLPEVDAPAESFDAITAWAVIEHVHDPRAYFETAARLLKPGG